MSIATPFDVEKVRADFPILQKPIHGKHPLVYLDNAASTQRPQVVIDAITQCYSESYANVHRGIHALSERATDLYEASRRQVQQFVNAEFTNEIVFTSGTTAAINLVASSLGEWVVEPGDEILLTVMEHHSNIVPWQQLAQRKGAIVKFVDIRDDGTIDLDLFQSMINRKTKIVSFASVSNVLGTMNPVQEMVAIAKKQDAFVLIDAAQSVPHEIVDVQKLGADFVAFSGHKMLGPSGIGILYGKLDLLEEMPAFLGGGSMINSVTTEGFSVGELPAKFEAGTPPIVSAIVLGKAIEYLQEIGLESIELWERELTKIALEKLNEISRVQILGPGQEQLHLRGGMVSFVVDGLNSQDIALLIDRKGIAIRAGHHCAMPLHKRLGVANSNRASFYLYNTPNEVEFFVETLKSVIEKLS